MRGQEAERKRGRKEERERERERERSREGEREKGERERGREGKRERGRERGREKAEREIDCMLREGVGGNEYRGVLVSFSLFSFVLASFRTYKSLFVYIHLFTYI